MAKTRYYKVRATLPKLEDGSGIVQEERLYLVEATGASAAERHVARKFVGPATIADPKTVADLMSRGTKPEVASES